MSFAQWLLFLPQVPSSPSSIRVQVWRRLRAAGAASIQNGVWVLPFTSQTEALLQEILDEASQHGASALLLKANPLNPELNHTIIEQFTTDRDQEYAEFCERCQGFLAEIEKETHNLKFTFAELEENEQDLVKLQGWLIKIKARDYFSAALAPKAEALLAECQRSLEGFAKRLYIKEGLASLEQQENGN